MNRSFFVLILMMLGLTGCASMVSDPYLKDVMTGMERSDLDDEDQSLKLSYMARYMMESDDRAELMKEIADTDVVRSWNMIHTSALAQMSTDVYMKQFSSSLGHMVGNSLFVAGLVWGEIQDGSMDTVSQAFLPEVFMGEILKTSEQADRALGAFTRKQVQEMADELGWDFECVYGCDTRNQIFTLKFDPSSLSGQYIYRTGEIAVKVLARPLVEVEPHDPISAMVGFPVKWKSPAGNTFLVEFYADLYRNDSGDLIVHHQQKEDFHYPAVDTPLFKTRLGRDLLRRFHSTPYTFMGTMDDYPHLIFREGQIYSFISNSDSRMVDLVIQEEPLLKRNTVQQSKTKTEQDL